jgi:hypothetical protein
MSLMSDSFVTSAELTTDATGTQIALTVQVDNFESGKTVEISGHATQGDGAFANYYVLKQVPDADPNNGGHKIVTVTTRPIPPSQFGQNQEVTVVLRVSMVWATVLQTQAAPSSTSGHTTWGPPKVVSSIDGTNWTP